MSKKDVVKFLKAEDFVNISDESVREYPALDLMIEGPLSINVSLSGGHRIVSSDGWNYYVQPKEGWWFRFKSKHENGFIF
jgi:hypothetical protein